MPTKPTPEQLSKVLDFLQTVYRVRLDVDLVPSILQEPFYKAAERFSKPGILQKFDRSWVGIVEEVADVAYQTLKLICLQKEILTEKSIRTLQDYLEKNNYYDSGGGLVGIDYQGLDELSIRLAPDDLVKELRSLLPDVMFSDSGNDGTTVIREFLAGQFVAYISRKWRGHKAGGLQTIQYIRDEKIPEETQELIEALVRSSETLTGDDLLGNLELNLDLAAKLLSRIMMFRSGASPSDLFGQLAIILICKMVKTITIEDTLRLMFLKMKGRQELNFYGFDDAEVRRICKPVEYLIEADMFF